MATQKSWWCALLSWLVSWKQPSSVLVKKDCSQPGTSVIRKELGVIFDSCSNQLVIGLFGPYDNYHALKLVVSSFALFPGRTARANGPWAMIITVAGP